MGVALGGNLGGRGGGGEALGCLWGLSDFFGLGGKGGAATAERENIFSKSVKAYIFFFNKKVHFHSPYLMTKTPTGLDLGACISVRAWSVA